MNKPVHINSRHIIGFLTGFLFLLLHDSCNESIVSVNISVDPDKEIHTLKGGIGASWHSMSKEIPLDNQLYEFPVREVNPRGSGYGGNPPVSDTLAWQQIYRHTDWLGLNWLRVELSQRMYEPQKGKYDWDNEEMQALYNILDWCEKNEADVFLQQMWHYVEWLAYEGVHPLLSAPKSLDDYATGIGELLNYLVRIKGYSCIKYLSIANEPPGGPWGYWWSNGPSDDPVTPAWKRVAQELKKREIDIPLSAPGWTSLPPFDSSKIDFDPWVGAYDIHSYWGIGDDGEIIISDWSEWAKRHGKPFFVTEIGNMNLGWGEDNPGPKTFEAALSNAEDIIRGINLGVDAFNRWSFTNRGNMDGQWQLIKTYDIENQEFLQEIVPEKEAYYGFGIITRFLSKYATVVGMNSECSSDSLKIFTTALKNPDGGLVLYLLNRSAESVWVILNIQYKTGSDNLYLYQVTKEKIMSEISPLSSDLLESDKGNYQFLLPPGSISTITDFLLTAQDIGIIAR